MAVLTATTTKERQPIRWHTVWVVLIAAFWTLIVIGIICGFFLGWKWTGFPENGKLWDWLQLLSAPVFVSALPFLFTGRWPGSGDKAKEQQEQASGQSGQGELQAVDEDKEEAILESYQNHILELLLDKNLVRSAVGSEVREVARARTLTTLRRLDAQHKGALLLFLREAGLIYNGKAIIDLREADLQSADLSAARLNGIDLRGVDLRAAILNKTDLHHCDLSNALLSGANLSGADLGEANLTGANLRGANLSGTNLKGASYSVEQLSQPQEYRKG